MSEYISFENLAASAKTEYEKLQANYENIVISYLQFRNLVVFL